NGKNIKRYLVETDLPVQGRYVFDEAALVLNSTIQDYSITMYSNSSFSPIENIVALNKRLLNKTISSKAKWLFVGIKLFVIPKPKESDIYRLEVEKRLGTKLIISSIMLNDTLIGTIKFSSK